MQAVKENSGKEPVMTHYRVAVIQTPDSPDVDTLMAPYNENMRVAPYIDMTRAEVIERGREKISEVRERLGEMPDSDYWRQFAALDGADDEAVYRQMADYYGNDADEEGNLLSTYNPDSKWDYYTVIEKVSFVDWLASGADDSDEELRAEWDKLSIRLTERFLLNRKNQKVFYLIAKTEKSRYMNKREQQARTRAI